MTLIGMERTLCGGHIVANFKEVIRAVMAKGEYADNCCREVGEPRASTFTNEVGNGIAENHVGFESLLTVSVEVPLTTVNPQLHSF